MAPFLIPAISSLASTVLDNLTQAKEARPAASQQAPQIEFDSLMKTRTLSGALAVQPSDLGSVSAPLMQQLVNSPEVSSALAGQNLPPGSQLEISAEGNVSLRSASGYTQQINLRPETQVLAANVRAAMNSDQ
jgi:hypothetical protein